MVDLVLFDLPPFLSPPAGYMAVPEGLGALSSRTHTQHLQDQHLILRTQLLVQDSSMLSMRLGASLEESWSSVSVGFTLQRFFHRVQRMRDCSVCLGISLWKRADKSRLICLKSKVILNLRLMS